jgi:hypothetical protein
MKRETAPRFAGIGGHHSHRAGTVEWLTPPEIIAALGPFDLDPCAPIAQPYPTARRIFTRRDNGLIQAWPQADRVWLNPPYANGQIEKWLARMAEHDFGTALIFARTETDAFFRHVWERATALLFMRGRINFHTPDGVRARGNAGAPTVLCAYGIDDADVLAGCKIGGQFVPLRIPRSVVVAAIAEAAPTWRAALAEFFAGQEGPVELAAIYRAFAGHPKAAGNRHVEAKLRQELQRGPYSRVGPGLWEEASG